MSSEVDETKLLADAKKLPWDERVGHKNWKVRQDAYVDMAAACRAIHDPKDSKLRDFGLLLKKAVTDSNAAAQEKGLDALISFQEAADVETASRFSKEICDALATKCFGGRSMTIERCRAAFLLWVELEAVEVVLDAMDKAIKNKVAKQVLPAVDVLYGALSQFGPKVVPPKRIVKMLQDLLNHNDNNVRRLAKDLTVELCRWIGKDALKRSLFDNLKKQAMEDIEKLLDTVEGDPKVTRRIRSEMDKEEEEVVPAAQAAAGKGAAAEEEEAPAFDDYEMADPIDVLALLAKTSFFEGIKSAKWSERKSAVAELTEAANKVRIAPGDFSEVNRALKKLFTDNNVAVVIEAVQAATNLAKGLRASYSSGAKFLLSTMLEKLKDKKATLVNAVKEALQALYKNGCLTFSDLWEDAVAATKNKVPGVRAETLAWLGYCVENTKKALLQKSIKDLAPVLVESLNDTAPEVRDAGFAALASVIKKVGMKPVERFVEQVDDVRKKKLSEMVVTEEAAGPQRSQSGPAGTGNRATQTDLSRAGSSGPSLLSKRPVLRPTNAVNQVSVKGAMKKPAGGAAAKKGAAASAGDAAPPEQVEPEPWSKELILEKATGVVPAQSMELMKSGAWKERVEGVGILKEDLDKPGRDLSADVEAIVRYVCLVPGLADKNVTVSQKVLEVISCLADKAPKFPKKCAVLCIPGVVERVGDLKTRLQAVACLTALSEAVGPRFVFERGSSAAGGHKNLKVLEGFLSWTMGAVEDFGSAEFDLKELINFCKTVGLASSNAACRSATLKLIGVLHKFVGPDLKSFFLDLKQAQLDLVNQEFEKNKYEGPPGPPARVPRGSAGSAGGAAAGGGGALPREDISGKISGMLIEKLSDTNWKVRQESLEAINTILEEAHNRVLPNGTSELFSALKGRLSDPNKNLILLAVTITANVASAMGPPADKSSKGLLGDVLKCLSDPKKPLRDTVLKALEAWVAAIQIEKAVPYVGAAITDPKLSADGRKDLLDWLQRRISAPPPGETPIEGPQGLLKACASGLQDKAMEVRRGAEALLAELVKAFGSDVVTRAAKSELQSQALAVVAPILDRHRSATPTGAEPLSAQSRDGAGPVVRSGTAGAALTKGGKQQTPVGKGREGATPIKSPLGGAQQQLLGRTEADLQSLPLFNLRESIKVERELQLRTRARQMDDARPEIIQELEVDSSKVFREDLLRRMFSPDFRLHLEAFDMLHTACHQEPKDAFEVVDLILRWVLLRLSDNNTACFLKALEFLSSLIEILRVEGCILTDVETSLLVPSLVEKLGHNMGNVREKVRELVQTLAFVCPASRIFHALVECLRHSKSSRTRVECVEVMDIMMENSGLEIMGHSKVPLVTLASLTAERDNEVRRVALNALCTAYKMQGEDIWKSLGKLTAAQVGLIQDKFKWKAREMEKRGEYVPGPGVLRHPAVGGHAVGGMGQADLRTSQESLQYQLQLAHQGQGAAYGALSAAYGAPGQAYYPQEQAVHSSYLQQQVDDAAYIPQDHHHQQQQQQVEESSVSYAQHEVAPRPSAGSSNGGAVEPGSWKEALYTVESAETTGQLLVGLSFLSVEIDRTREQDDSTAALEYSFDVDRLMNILVHRFVDTFHSQGQDVAQPEFAKTCKYILNCVLSLFRQRIMAQAVSEETLRELMEALSMFLLDERTKRSPKDADHPNPIANSLTNLCKAVNVLVLRILALAPPNTLFAAFIQILRPNHYVNGMPAEEIRGPDGTQLSQLIVKCLLKMSRSFDDYVDTLDFDRFLLDLHRYFSDFSSNELRRKLTSDERTMAILKMLLNNAVAAKGPAIKGHLSLIPLEATPPPFILTQIDLALQRVLEERVAYQQVTAGMQGVSMDNHAPVVDVAAVGAPMGAPADEPDAREQLMNIMRIIHDPRHGAQGLVQLYSFTHLNPEVDVFSELHLISDQSKQYLKMGLLAVDQHIHAGYDASTFTMTGELAMGLQQPPPDPQPVAVRPSLAEAAPRFSRASAQQQQQQEHRNSAQLQEQPLSVQLREQRATAQQQEYRISALLGEQRRSTQQQEPRTSTQLQELRTSADLQGQPPSATGGHTRDVIASLRARLNRVHSGGSAAE